MTLDPGTLQTINNIYTDVHELTTNSIPGIREELVALSLGIAINKRDIGGLVQWKDDKGSEMEKLAGRTGILETAAKKRSANLGEALKTILAICQALVTAFLISKLVT